MKLKQTAIAILTLSGLSTSAVAGVYDSSTGYWPVGGEHSAFSTNANPVNNHTALNDSDFSVGLGAVVEAEVSGAENLINNFESTIQAAADLAALPESVADAFTAQYKNAELYAATGIDIPVLVKTNDYGTISVEYSKSMGVMAKAFEHNQSNGSLLIADVQLGMQNTYSEKSELAVGFARELSSVDVADTFGEGAKVTYGVKGRLLQTGGNLFAYNLNRNLLSSQDIEQELEDIVKGLDDSVALKTGFTADLGVRVDTPNWNLGVLAKNIIPVDVDLAVKHNAFATADMGGFYATKFEINPYAVIDGSIYTEGRNWKLSGFAETNKHMNFAGNEQQNIGVNAAYISDSGFIPSVRFGMSKNLVGSELAKYSAGVTFGIVNLDVSTSSLSYNSSNQEDLAASAALSIEATF